jgi:hypothetical protein
MDLASGAYLYGGGQSEVAMICADVPEYLAGSHELLDNCELL